jgi:hypothetical protein
MLQGVPNVHNSKSMLPTMCGLFVCFSIFLIMIGVMNMYTNHYVDGYMETECSISNCTKDNITISGGLICSQNGTFTTKTINTTIDCKNTEINCYYQCFNLTFSLTINEPKIDIKTGWLAVVIIFVITLIISSVGLIYYIRDCTNRGIYVDF